MSWKFVFNTGHLGIQYSLPDVVKLAKQAGYKFYLWSGEVFFINGEETGIKRQDLV